LPLPISFLATPAKNTGEILSRDLAQNDWPLLDVPKELLNNFFAGCSKRLRGEAREDR
jgi:hypothetical protein